MSKARSVGPANADELRSAALVQLGDVAAIQRMSREGLLALQAQFGFGCIWGVVEIPASFMPPGRQRTISRRFFDFRELAEGNDAAIEAVTKFMCLRWLVPVGTNTRPPATSTLGGCLRNLKRLLQLALKSKPDDSGGIWSRLTATDLYSILPVSANGTDFGAAFRTFKEKGLLDDVIDVPLDRTAKQREKSRKGSAAPKSVVQGVAPFLHLPDRFVAECGWRCIWVIKTLAPSLLSLLEHVFSSQTLRTDVLGVEAHTHFRKIAAGRIRSWSWLDHEARAIEKLPFALNLSSRAGLKPSEVSKPMSWPPRTLPDLWALLALVQGAHAFIVGVSGGPRHSEILSQTQGVLVESSEGFRLEGKTYKLVFRDQGQERDWPAPEMAVRAVLQQVRLARFIHLAAAVFGCSKQGEHLWVRLPNRQINAIGAPLLSLDVSIKNLVTTFELESLLSGQSIRETSIHLHRLRKTTARIVGLTLTNSIQVLMDLFGHDDPEMTMRYLLSNPDIAEEARAVAEAQTIMLAAEAIEQANQGGGAAAHAVRAKVAEYARLRGIDKLDAQNIDELARDLTENGQYWELVRPGVLCTKLPGQIGACNGKQGAPDSSHCKSTCANRFEMAANRVGVDGAIRRILEHLQRALDDDEPMLAEQWRGQLVHNVLRFDDLRIKWSRHPLVAAELMKTTAGGASP